MVESWWKVGGANNSSLKAFSSPEPVVSWSRGRETRGWATGRLQIKPSGSGDENGLKWEMSAREHARWGYANYFHERMWNKMNQYFLVEKNWCEKTQ